MTSEQIQALARVAACRSQIERLLEPDSGDLIFNKAAYETLARLDVLAKLIETPR